MEPRPTTVSTQYPIRARLFLALLYPVSYQQYAAWAANASFENETTGFFVAWLIGYSHGYSQIFSFVIMQACLFI